MNLPTLAEVVLTPVEEIREKARAFVRRVNNLTWSYQGDALSDSFTLAVSQLLQDHELAILKRNAPPVPDATLTLPFARTDDPEITCILCGRAGVDYGLTVRRPGARVLVGLHERCRRET